MRDAQPYDTLDEFGDEICSAQQLVDTILGSQRGQPVQPVVGFIVSGEYSRRDTLGWGRPTRIGSTVLYLRSAPRNRLGKQLHKREVRIISTLCFSLKTGRASISIAKLYLRGEIDDIPNQTRDACAPLSMPLIPLLIFSDHLTPKPGCIVVRSAHGHKLVIPTSVAFVEPGGTKRIESGHHESQVAAALIGLQLSDTALKPVQCMSVQEWTLASAQILERIEENLCTLDTSGFTTRSVLNTAASICEGASASGLIDLLSTPALLDSIPDALERPDSILCVIAAMTRIAAYPEMLGLEHGTPSDAWAAYELASCFEANYSSIAHSEEGRFMAIDVAIRVSFHHASLSGNTDIHNDSINYLFQCGVALCFDLFGPISEEATCTEYGQSKTADCVRVAHLNKAHANGIRTSAPSVYSLRLNSRAEHQETLMRILDRVELFLRNDTEGRRDCSLYTAPEVFDEETEQEDQYQNLLNISAMKTVISVLQRVQTRGSMCLELERINVYPVSQHMQIACVGCQQLVHVLEPCMFSAGISRCPACERPYCCKCGSGGDVECLRCSHSATAANT